MSFSLLYLYCRNEFDLFLRFFWLDFVFFTGNKSLGDETSEVDGCERDTVAELQLLWGFCCWIGNGGGGPVGGPRIDGLLYKDVHCGFVEQC